MPSTDNPDLSLASVIRDLDAVRKRLDQAPTWLKDAETTVSAAALAGEVRLLCQQAFSTGNPQTARRLLAKTTKFLEDLEILLGVH